MIATALLTRLVTWSRAGYLLWRARSARTEARRLAAERSLKELLGRARGLTTKIGQASSSLLDAESALAYGLPGGSWNGIRAAVDASLGYPNERVFASVADESIAASIGQVHRGKLLSGQNVAIKVRYPEAARAVRAELRVANWLPAAGPIRAWSMDLAGYKSVLDRQLEAELDYRGEAERQRLYASAIRVPGLVVPAVVDELCREALLVQSWEEGETLESASTWPETERRKVGQIVLRTFMTSIFAHGLIHADPHAGNFRFRLEPRPQFVLFDFGSMMELSWERRRALLRLIQALRDGEDDLVVPCLAEFGFDAEKLQLLGERSTEALRLILAPWLEDRPFDARSWNLRSRVDSALGETKWAFRSAAPVESILLVRALSGLVRIVTTLDVRFPWWPFVRECLGPDALSEVREWRPAAIVATRAERRAEARWLQISVDGDGAEPFRCSLPARDALALSAMTPGAIRQAIENAGVCLGAIESRLRSEGLRAQELFDVVVERRRYRLWLED